MTDALTRYLIRTQRTEGFWIDPTRRPPMEDGVLVATAWAALSVRDYAPAADPRAKADSLARAATWLEQQTPATHNETVMQLLGLHWSEVPAKRLAASRERVVHSQRADGGWAQLKTLESDAWATGLALYALHEVGMKTTDPVYQRGVAFLLRTQFEDGSWWVRSRSWPFQPHFDGQFPHGKDQWISQGATAWAAMALLFTLEPTRANAVRPSTENLIATFKASVSGAAATSERKLMAQAGRVVDFARDIRPLFERSCAGCHGAEKPRAGLTVLSATALLKGGASGEPSIIPGDADASPLVQYVTGKIEDLEMPPLDRREKYPALAPEEIALLRGWISAGAPGESVGQR